MIVMAKKQQKIVKVSGFKSAPAPKIRSLKFITTDPTKLESVSIAKASASIKSRGRGRPKGSKNHTKTTNSKKRASLCVSSSSYSVPTSVSQNLCLEPSATSVNKNTNSHNFPFSTNPLNYSISYIDNEISISSFNPETPEILDGLDSLEFDLCRDNLLIKQEPLVPPEMPFMSPNASSPDCENNITIGESGHVSKPVSPTPGFLLSPSSNSSPNSSNRFATNHDLADSSSSNIRTNSNTNSNTSNHVRRSTSKHSSTPQQSAESTEPTTGKPKATKRRPHSKSRHGCKTCKRRRVKCDETHPICNNCKHLSLECSFAGASMFPFVQGGLNIMDIRLFYHYTTVVWKTIVAAGISNQQIWEKDIPELAFEYPFLMHAVLTFSANHFSRTHKTEFENDPSAIEQVVTFHRGDALKLLAEAVKNVTPKNLDALVASSILLILDAMANASASASDDENSSSLPASAWLHHVRGAATILTAVGPPTPESRFFRLVNVDLSDLALGLVSPGPADNGSFSSLECFDEELSGLYPLNPSSPYFNTLCYLEKLFRQRYKSDFILRVFSFPALLDNGLVQMLLNGDVWAKRIIKVYYKLVRSFTSEMKETVWFLEGVAKILPIDTDKEFGGLGFITKALPLNLPTGNELIASYFGNNAQQHILDQVQRQQQLYQSQSRQSSISVNSSAQEPDFLSQREHSVSTSNNSGSLNVSTQNNVLSGFHLDSLYPASELSPFAPDLMMRGTSNASTIPSTNAVNDNPAINVIHSPTDTSIGMGVPSSAHINSISTQNDISLNNLVNCKFSSAEFASLMNGMQPSPNMNTFPESNTSIRHNSTPSSRSIHPNSMSISRRHTYVEDILGNNSANNDSNITVSDCHQLSIDPTRFSNETYQSSSNNGKPSTVSNLENNIGLSPMAWKQNMMPTNDQASSSNSSNNRVRDNNLSNQNQHNNGFVTTEHSTLNPSQNS